MEQKLPRGYVMYIPTFRCNYRCEFCFLDLNKLVQLKREEVPLERVIKVFEDSKILKGLLIQISGGEPFLRKGLPEFIVELNRLGHHVNVTTNGSFPELVKKSYDLTEFPDLLSLNVSLDGINDIHNQIRKNKDAYENALLTIKNARNATKANIQVNTVLFNENIDQIMGLRKILNDYSVIHVPIPLASKDGDFKALYQKKELNKIIPYLHHPLFIDYVLSKNLITGDSCHAGSSSVFIDPYGDVFPCEVMGTSKHESERKKFVMGNILHSDFDDIWSSDDAEKVRKNSIQSCEGCFTFCNAFREYLYHGLKVHYSADDLLEFIELPKIIEMSDSSKEIFLPNGWYGPDQGFRHSMQESEIILKNTAGGRLFLELRNMHPSKENKVKVFINSKYVKTLNIPPTNDFKIFSVDYFNLSRGVKIKLVIDHVWKPSEVIGNNDFRWIGLSFNRIWIESYNKVLKNEIKRIIKNWF